MKPKLGQTAVFGLLNVGQVTAIRGGGFYVRTKHFHRPHRGPARIEYRSTFFRFDQIGPNGHTGNGTVTLHDTLLTGGAQ